MSGNAPTRENSLKLSRKMPMRRVEGDFTVFTLPHAMQRATLAGIGTTGSLVAAVAVIAALTTGVVAFHAWPTPHRATPHSLELGSGNVVGARTPLLAPTFGVGRAGTLPHATLPPAVARNNEAAGPAEPTIRSAPSLNAGHPGQAPALAASQPSHNTVAKAPSTSSLATATTKTGKSTAATVGGVADQVSDAASKVSPVLGVGVQAAGVSVSVSVQQLTETLAKIVGEITGPAQHALPAR